VPPNLPCRKQHAHAVSIHANIVADGCEILRSSTNQRLNQIFWNPAEPEATDHDGGAIGNITNGFICVGNYFIHWENCKARLTTEARRHGENDLNN
jgi:hypothetical protein